MPLSPGTIVDHYEIRSRLSAGQQDEIYLARDLRFDREVAIRLLPKQFTEITAFRQRLERELLTASTLDYPGILSVYDLGVDRGQYFIVTETFDASLRDRLSAGPIRLPEALDIAIQVAGALEAAHARGIIHRDIKPENILLRRNLVKVADFGLAKLREHRFQEEIEDETTTTRRGVVLGTVAYMSPEQLLGESVDARTDIWSLGVILYEMITGHRPFEGATATQTIISILHHIPALPIDYLPIEIQRILNKALNKDRDERYQSASDFLADLLDIREPESEPGVFSSPAIALPYGSWTGYTFERIRQRPIVGNALIALLSIAVVVVAMMFFWSPRPNRERVLREELEEATAESESYARNRYYSVEPITVTSREGKVVTGYDAENVIAAIRSTQADLAEGIRAPELTPLRDYVGVFYPVPQIETLERVKLEKPTEDDLNRVLITEGAKNGAFENVFEFISRIRALVAQRRLSIDLTVSSAPQDGASFDMWASGGPHRTTSTNNIIDNVYRGFYRYKVTKGGFKQIEESLNLVDSDGRQLDCFLNQLNDQDGPRPCKLR